MRDLDLRATTLMLTGAGGDSVEAYLAEPTEPGSYPGVVVIHHRPGWDRETKEFVRRFAARGYLAICPNLHYREAPGADAATAAEAAQTAGGVPDARLVDDVRASVEHLRRLPASTGQMAMIGHCSGGRQAWVVAAHVSVDAAIVCYGGRIVAGEDELDDRRPVAPIDMTRDIGCPLLGLFGAEDRNPSPEAVSRMEQELVAHSKDFEFHTYLDAGHAFFSIDRPSHFRAAAALDGWERIWDFLGRHLGDPASGRALDKK